MDTAQNEMPMPPYNQDEADEREIQVRGKYLMMSCDIEYCLLQIIIFCNPSPNNNDRTGKFKKMTMGEKINNVICDMKKYKQPEYMQYKEYFDGLEEFRIVRNHVAHDKAEFINKELNPIRFAFVEYDNITGKECQRYTEFPNLYITQSLHRFGVINHYLGLLWVSLQQEYYKVSNEHPLAHPSTFDGKGDKPDDSI